MTRNRAPGYIESAQQLVDVGSRSWSQAELLRAAEAGELHNTGWPIGLVIHRDELAPQAREDGIEARLTHRRDRWDDYWRFLRDGSYYVVRIFEEEYEQVSYQTSEGHPDKPLWFDMRLWRVAEVVLHSASLYRELGVPTTEPYVLAVNHRGLAGRELSKSDMRWALFRGRLCTAEQASWQREVTQDLVVSALSELVHDIASELFVLFDFFELPRETTDAIVHSFLESRL